MAFYREPMNSKTASALNDCGCGRSLSGLHDTLSELEQYVRVVREKLSKETIPARRAELEQELNRYEGLLREELSKINLPNTTPTVPRPNAPQQNSSSGSEKNFLTEESIISGVPNWMVAAGAIAAGYVVYELVS